MANNRQQQVDELSARLVEGTAAIFESDQYANYLKVMSRFTHYSVRNTILIAMQTNGTATRVAGYSTWQRLGRNVNKGEKAIKILAPTTYKKKKEVDVTDPNTGEVIYNPDGTTVKEEVEVNVPSFRVANVFDVSQTSGRPLPSLVNDIEGDVDRYRDFVSAIRTVSPVPIAFEDMDDKDGYYHQVEQRIAINDSMSQKQTVAALIHEVSHAKLHALDPNNLRESAKLRGKDQRTMEVEAESIATVVASYFGIDTSENSWGYVASWSKNKELPELHASLQIIKDTARELIEGIEVELLELDHAYLDQEEALEAFGHGEHIFGARARGDFFEVTHDQIANAPQNTEFRMPKDEWMYYVGLRNEMDLRPGITSIREAELLLLPQNQFGIYQINSDTDGRAYEFMGMDYLENQGLQANHKHYSLVYVDIMTEDATLDNIYEEFNLDRPEDFTGHSLSVSDVIVMNQNGEIHAYYVDSFGFREIPDFLENVMETDMDLQQAAFQIADRYIEAHRTDGGIDYSIYDEKYQLLDGGVYDDPGLTVFQVAKDVATDLKEPIFNTETGAYERQAIQGNVYAGDRLRRMDYDTLDERVQAAYKPLAKVEELEEQNYNMVDNVLNNGAGDKAKIHYYVAVCEEFHDMQDYYDGLTFEEAVEKYQKIIDDPSLAYYGNSMGIIVSDTELEEYNEQTFPLVMGKTICGDQLDIAPKLLVHPLVQMALVEVKEAFPEFTYHPPKSLLEVMYPEKMTAQELAGAIIDLSQEYDFYEFQDSYESLEMAIDQETLNLLMGEKKAYLTFLHDVIEDGGELADRAKILSKRLEAYEPEKIPEMKPMVQFSFSSLEELPNGKWIPMEEANEMIKKANSLVDSKQQEEKYAKTYSVVVRIVYQEEGNVRDVSGRLALGNKGEGILEGLQSYAERNLFLIGEKDTHPVDSALYKTASIYGDMLEHTLPYLQQYVSLEERAPMQKADVSKETEAPIVTKPGEKTASTKATKSSEQSKEKKSIHERLKENKEKVANRQGKAVPQKGVELA
ncbi:YodL domain-containing protein [Streptococcus alactolyticus]|uniref:YodL domain-containing protein n=1 Tax=Streptococcus alactolyticus TaxID=29389 RepID=UPI003F9849BC